VRNTSADCRQSVFARLRSGSHGRAVQGGMHHDVSWRARGMSSHPRRLWQQLSSALSRRGYHLLWAVQQYRASVLCRHPECRRRVSAELPHRFRVARLLGTVRGRLAQQRCHLPGDSPGMSGRVSGSRQRRLFRHHCIAVYHGCVQLGAGLCAGDGVLLAPLRDAATRRDLLRPEHDAVHTAVVFTVATLRPDESDLCAGVSAAGTEWEVL